MKVYNVQWSWLSKSGIIRATGKPFRAHFHSRAPCKCFHTFESINGLVHIRGQLPPWMHCGNSAYFKIVTWKITANQNTAFNKWTVPKQKDKRAKLAWVNMGPQFWYFCWFFFFWLKCCDAWNNVYMKWIMYAGDAPGLFLVSELRLLSDF